MTNAPSLRGVALRYGNFYGPGSSIARDGDLAELIVGASMMTRIRGASNAKAKRELSWRPRYAN